MLRLCRVTQRCSLRTASASPSYPASSRHYWHLDIKNAIRPTAIGKKNWLFIGDADAGQRSAIIYTIIESCRRRALDPYAYLREVLTRLPNMTNRQIPEVTPETWSKARLQVQRQAAS